MLWISLFATALCLILAIYWLALPSLQSQQQTPNDLNIHRAWFWFWPWVDRFSQLASPFMTWSYQFKLEQDIIRSGRLDSLKPSHIIGMQVGAFFLGIAFGLFVGLSLFKTSLMLTLLYSVAVGCLCFVLPRHALKKQAKKRQRLMLKQFPFFLDMITLCVEGGLNLQAALMQTTHLLPDSPLKKELIHALGDMKAGMPRLEALKAMAYRSGLNEIQHLVATIAQTDALGAGLGPILRSQSEQRRSERFLRAEKLALEAPVKMLFPLVSCIFPCTFIVLAFPIGMKLLNAQW